METTAEIAPARSGRRELVTRWLRWGLLAAVAAGIPLDGLLAVTFGSSSLALGVPLVVAAVWTVVASGRVRALPAPLVALAAFTAWSAASVLWAVDGDEFAKRLLTNAQLLALVLVCWQVLHSDRELRALLTGFVAGCLVTVALAWQAFLRGEALVDGGTRYTAKGIDANDMSVTLAVAIPMAAYLALTGARVRSRAAFLYVPFAASAIALSGSRGGTLTAATALASVLIWTARRSGAATAAATLLAVVAVAGAWALVPEENFTRIFTVQEQLRGGGTMGDRVQIWHAGLDLLARHPLAGVGAGGFSKAISAALNARTVAHNTPLSIAVEHGIIGLVIFGSALVLVLRHAARADPPERALAWSLVVTWCVGSASLTWEYRKTTWLVILMGAALGVLRQRRGEAKPG